MCVVFLQPGQLEGMCACELNDDALRQLGLTETIAAGFCLAVRPMP